jgi:YD repeat-containing protein
VIAVVIGVLAMTFSGAVFAADVDYAYDEAGRLVGVIAPNGDSAQYVYDPAGNITEIKRFNTGQLALIEFLPKSGPVGTSVTIWGSGFSTTPALNGVSFNGTAATVASATANKLVVTVPPVPPRGRSP